MLHQLLVQSHQCIPTHLRPVTVTGSTHVWDMPFSGETEVLLRLSLHILLSLCLLPATCTRLFFPKALSTVHCWNSNNGSCSTCGQRSLHAWLSKQHELSKHQAVSLYSLSSYSHATVEKSQMPQQFLSVQRKLKLLFSQCLDVCNTFLSPCPCYSNGASKKSSSQTVNIQFSLFKSTKQTLKLQRPEHNEPFMTVFGLQI